MGWFIGIGVKLTRRLRARTSLAAAIGPSGVTFLNTESFPAQRFRTLGRVDHGRTLWGGIYAAEYIMRMSTVPAVLHVGPSEISYQSGVFFTNQSAFSGVIWTSTAPSSGKNRRELLNQSID